MPSVAKKFRGKNRAQWAKIIGVSYSRICHVISVFGWEYAIENTGSCDLQKGGTKADLYTYLGETLPLVDWASKINMSYSGFYARVKKNGFAAAFEMGSKNYAGGLECPLFFVKKYDRKMTISEVADLEGLNRGTLSARMIRKGGGEEGLEKAIAMGKPRRKSDSTFNHNTTTSEELKEPPRFNVIREAIRRGLVKCHKTGEKVFSPLDCMNNKCPSKCFDGIRH